MGLFSVLGSVLGGIGGAFVGMPGLGASIGGGLGGALDGSKAKSSNNKAVNAATAAQTAGINSAIAGNNLSTSQSLAGFAPWMKNGGAAVASQGDLLGLNGNGAQQTSIDGLKASPLYQSLFGNGQNTLLANAAATGGLRGGNTQGALANFGRDTLAQVIQSQLANLGGVSGQGLSAAGSSANVLQNNNQINADLLTGRGSVQASGILGNQAVNNAGNASIASSLGSAFGGGNLEQLLSGLGIGSSSVNAPTFNWGSDGSIAGVNF